MRIVVIIGITLLAFGLLSSCNKTKVPDPSSPPKQADPITEQIAKMSTAEKVGQLVIVGLEGTSLQLETREMIETYHVSGFILYRENVESVGQVESLIRELNKASEAPLWISVDQEGGRVNRMPAGMENEPTAKQVGDTDDLGYTREVGSMIGDELTVLGFNMNFAPVLDVNSNPNNPVIGDRSFGTSPDVVMRHGVETMKAIRAKGIVPVVKHFPGHGDTSVDSHLELPVVNKSLDELRKFELVPFAEAIKNGAEAVMVAHILLPKIDTEYPASLSVKVINGLLRDDMGFDGIVVTDDMTMGGIVKHYDIGEAAVKSVLAGSDIILVGHDRESQVKVLEALAKAVEDGTITSARLDQSVERITRLKQSVLANESYLRQLLIDPYSQLRER